MALDQVDRAAQSEATLDRDWVVAAGGIGLLAVSEPKGQLEALGTPSAGILGHPPQPLAQIGANRGDAILPDLFNRRRQLVMVEAGTEVEFRVDEVLRCHQIIMGNRQHMLLAQSA